MKRIAIFILLLCCVLYAGCTNKKDGENVSLKNSQQSEVLGSELNASDSDDMFTSGDFTCRLMEDGVAITGYNGKDASHVDIPQTINGLEVVEINYENGGFYKTGVESVTLPNSLKRIKGSLFYRTGVSTLHIPKSVEFVYSEPFFKSNTFKGYTVDPDNQYYTAVDGVLFTKDMKTLVSYPECAERDEYVIPEGVETISEGAFAYSAWNLKHVTLPSSMKEFDFGCVLPKFEKFTVHPDNPYFRSVEGVIYNEDITELLGYPSCNPQEKFVIPDTVTVIDEGAFSERLPALKEIYFPDNVEYFEWNADTSATFIGKSGSVVEAVAKDNNIEFKAR